MFARTSVYYSGVHILGSGPQLITYFDISIKRYCVFPVVLFDYAIEAPLR